jgi:hypothetical protein
VGRADDLTGLLPQPGNVALCQAAGLQGASGDDAHLAAADYLSPGRPDPAGAMDGNRNDRHLVGDRDDEGAVLELADGSVTCSKPPSSYPGCSAPAT